MTPPNSVFREVQEAIYHRFIDGWQADGEPLTAVQLGNETFDPPDAPWARVLVQRRPGGAGTIGSKGNRKMDRAGVVFVLLREPPGDGVGNITDLGEFAAKLFENCRLSVHGIRFGPVEPGEASDIEDGRWWGLPVEGRFDYEEIR